MSARPATAPTEMFGPLAGAYAEARPGYPPELFDTVVSRLDRRPATAADLAAGTGAATLPLVERGIRTVSIEPNRAMLARARATLGGREAWLGAVVAPAEALPLADERLDLVTAAQAFHWFEPRAALGEAARALRPGGLLAIFWNVVVEDDFVADVRALVERYNPAAEGRPVTERMRRTPAALAAHPGFAVEPPVEYAHARTLDADRFVAYALSWSYCGGALEETSRGPFERELRETIARHHGERAWKERLVTTTHLARRVT